MSVSVTKAGPYFSSGDISLGSLRDRFRESSGQIKMSELVKDTNVNSKDPIVPDSTENSNIKTSRSNMRFSDYRNSVKRYYATQSGTDTNSGKPDQPGFRMGRYYAIDGSGIDWCGQGASGPDGSSYGGNVNDSNLARNIQKFIYITGTCGSFYQMMPAAQLAPVPNVYNARIEVSGKIRGYGGNGGTSGSPAGENGGAALNFSFTGSAAEVTVKDTATIYGGGGGGAAGRTGNTGPAGVCYDRRTYTRGSGCEWCGDCGSPNNPVTVNGVRYNSYGARRIGGCGGKRGCSCAFGYYNGIVCRKTELNEARCEVYDPIAKSGGPGGAGGNGGNGRGYEKAPTSGIAGAPGTGSCPTYASRGDDGETGGNGGEWGEDGKSTNRASGGRAGAAVNGNSYTIKGTLNSNTIRGYYRV